MTSIPALKSFMVLDTSELPPSLSDVHTRIEALRDTVCKDDPTSADFNEFLQNSKSAIASAGVFIGQLIKFTDNCQDSARISKAIKEQDAIQVKVCLQELLKCIENSISSIKDLDTIICKIWSDCLNKAGQHSVDAQRAEQNKSTATYAGVAIGVAAAGGFVTSAVLGIVTIGVGVGGAVLSAAGLGVGTTATVAVTKMYSQTMEKSEQLKEEYHCISKSAEKIQEVIPKIIMNVQLMEDKIHQWCQDEDIVKNLSSKLEEFKYVCKIQAPRLKATKEYLSKL